jgi:hypothetical protein
MDGLKSVAIYGTSAVAGFEIDRNITLPSVSSNTTINQIVNIGIGLSAVIIGLHIEHEAGKILAFAGMGYAGSAVLTMAGY